MNYQKVLNIFKMKTQLKNVENIKLSDGKIEPNFIKSIIRTIKERCFRVEFNSKSRYAWHWRPNVTMGKIAMLFSAPATEAAKHRADIIMPRISRATVKNLLADLLECSADQINEKNPVRSMTLPVCGYQAKSYLTVIYWLEEIFRFKVPPEIISNGSIEDLTDYIANQ